MSRTASRRTPVHDHEGDTPALDLIEDERAAFNVGNVNGLVMGIIGAVVAILIVASLAGVFFSSISGLNENLSTASTGSTVGDTIASTFVIVVAVGAVIGLVGLVLSAIKLRGS